MKKKLQENLRKKLFQLSQQVLEQYKPTVIAITGSVGKTSTKDAIETVLAVKESVRASSGNYNNEIGLPLTIFGEQSPGKNAFGWWGVLRRARKLVKNKQDSYPETLVLEMGMDHPGDLAQLVAIAPPSISVVTNVSGSHLEFFESVEAIAKEKSTIVSALQSDGIAILNVDNGRTQAMRDLHDGKIITFGIDNEADVRASNIKWSSELPASIDPSSSYQELKGLGVPLSTVFTLNYGDQTVEVRLARVLGRQHVYAALAAAAVGIARGMSVQDISEALGSFVSPKGRMNLIPGLKNTLIIDDSYNSSPVSTKEALKVLGNLKPKGRRIAVLGDMAELGAATEEGHREVGKAAAKSADFAIFVGPKMKMAAESAEAEGLADERQTIVNDSRQVEAVLQKMLRAGDVLLVKGSQVMRMEKVVKGLMAEPLLAPRLLVRQTGLWKNK